MPKKSPPNIISRHSRVVKNRYRVGHRLGVAHFLGVVHGLECLKVDRTASRSSKASGSFTASRSSSTFWFQVPLGLVLVLRNHETCVSPSRHETCVLPSRLVPRGRPHRLGVVHGLEVGLHPLVPSLTWIIYAHGTCVSPSRLVPRGRPHRIGVVRGLEIVLHLLVPSPTWIIYAHGTCVSPSRLVPRGRPHRLGVVRGLEVVLHPLVPSPTWIIYAHGTCVSPSRLVPRGRPHRLGVVRGLEVILHLLVPSPTWLCFGSPKPRNLCFAFTPASASRSTAPPRGRRGLEVVLHLLVPSPTWIIYAHGTCVSPSRLVPRGRPHRLGVVRGLEVVLHLLVPSPTWLCFGSPKPRNLCFTFTPSASRRRIPISLKLFLSSPQITIKLKMSSQVGAVNHRENAEVFTDPAMCKQKSLELLEEINMPRGLLPLDEYVEVGRNRETGFVWMKQKKAKEHKFKKIGKLVWYDTEVTAFVEDRRLKHLTGVKSKELLLWVTLTHISIPDPDAGKITFSTPAGLSRSYPVSAFEVDAAEDDQKK
nr:uncharacterized protein LOC104109132 [Ipomoea batatas]